MAFFFIGKTELEPDADSLVQELFCLAHYSSLITQDMYLSAKRSCQCTKDQLFGLGYRCDSCESRFTLNRVTSQFKQSKKLLEDYYNEK